MPTMIPKPKQPEVRQLTLTEDAEITMLTFGGRQMYVQEKGHVFPFDILVARNDDYVVIQCGLNYYVVPAGKCRLPDDPIADPRESGVWVNDRVVRVPARAVVTVTSRAIEVCDRVVLGPHTVKDRADPTVVVPLDADTSRPGDPARSSGTVTGRVESAAPNMISLPEGGSSLKTYEEMSPGVQALVRAAKAAYVGMTAAQERRAESDRYRSVLRCQLRALTDPSLNPDGTMLGRVATVLEVGEGTLRLICDSWKYALGQVLQRKNELTRSKIVEMGDFGVKLVNLSTPGASDPDPKPFFQSFRSLEKGYDHADNAWSVGDVVRHKDNPLRCWVVEIRAAGVMLGLNGVNHDATLFYRSFAQMQLDYVFVEHDPVGEPPRAEEGS